MSEQNVQLRPADGGDMFAYAAAPSGSGPRPGLIVFPEAFGVNHHMRAVVDRFAEAGYVAICPELYHRTAPAGWECGYTEWDKVNPHLQAVTTEGLEHDARACWEWLSKHAQVGGPQIGCVGFCLGGRAAYVANLVLPLKAAVSYYGGRIVPALLPRAAELHGPMLFYWGGKDQHIGAEAPVKLAEALRAAQKPFVNVEISYADHGFNCDERSAYHPQASREAWALTLAFLRENF